LLTDSKPVIELQGSWLQFERPGYFPDLQDSVYLLDTLYNLAKLIEQARNSPGAG
jgi:hypothetical protein